MGSVNNTTNVLSNSMNDAMAKALKNAKNEKNKVSRSMKAELDLQTTDWMKLLVAQLKNQDMNNQMDTQEMTAQMAQYSQIQAVQNMVTMQENMFAMYNTSYAASLIGKDVTVAEVKTIVNSEGKKEDKVTSIQGKVTGVTLFEGEPHIYIGEKKFSLSQIMIVGEVPTKPKSPENSNVEGGAQAGGNNSNTNAEQSGNGQG